MKTFEESVHSMSNSRAIDAPPEIDDGRRAGGRAVLAGLISTALTLFGVWWLDSHTEFQIMGLYHWVFVPTGAAFTGAIAGSGYGLAAYLLGHRVRASFLAVVVALQLGGYFGAQFVEYRALAQEGALVESTGQTMSFRRYYQAKALSFAFVEEGKPDKPVGKWGYLFLGLGVLGFALGGVYLPLVLMGAPYCGRCGRYMKSRVLALVPASVRFRRVQSNDAVGQALLRDEHWEAAAAANALLARVTELARRNDGPGIDAALSGYPPKGKLARRAARLPARLRIKLVSCCSCSDGHLLPAMVTGQGRAEEENELDRVDLHLGLARMLHNGGGATRSVARLVGLALAASLMSSTGCVPSFQRRYWIDYCERNNDACLTEATTGSAIQQCTRWTSSCVARSPR